MSASAASRPPALMTWWVAIRPRTLFAGLAPVLVGLGLARDGVGDLRIGTAFVCLFGALSAQILANLVNDYYDFFRGADGARRVGPTRVLAAGWVSPQAMRRAMQLAALGVLLAGAFLTYTANTLEQGIWVSILTVLCMVSAWAYTGGPFPLAYHGWGDVFAFAFFGPVAVAATFTLQTDLFDWRTLVVGMAPGAFAAAILTVNNLRDREGDALARKRTLAVVFGEGFAKAELVFCAVVIGAVTGFAAWQWKNPFLLAALLAVAFWFPGLRRALGKAEGAEMNRILARTSLSMLLWSALYAAACFLKY